MLFLFTRNVPDILLKTIDQFHCSAHYQCFEKAIFHRLFYYLQQHKIINQWQSGFTPGDSTINQLVSMYHTFAEALDQKKDVRLVLCDVTATFDRVWHKGLIYTFETMMKLFINTMCKLRVITAVLEIVFNSSCITRQLPHQYPI